MSKDKKSNVVSIEKAKKQKQKKEEQRPCSFHTVSDKGNDVHGIAAFLVESKRAGGVDNFIRNIAQDSAEIALQNAMGGGKKNKKSS